MHNICVEGAYILAYVQLYTSSQGTVHMAFGIISYCLCCRWMDERCLRPFFCTIKAELGRGQPGLMR